MTLCPRCLEPIEAISYQVERAAAKGSKDGLPGTRAAGGRFFTLKPCGHQASIELLAAGPTGFEALLTGQEEKR